jgi:hypothetical protein
MVQDMNFPESEQDLAGHHLGVQAGHRQLILPLLR